MDKIYEKSYEKLIVYVKTKILQKEYVVGDKLPSERELAKILEISRNSVREGIRILERIGVISCQHGSGNFIKDQFDETLTEVLSIMYVLKGMNMEEITDFRFGLEYGAVNLAVKNVTEEQKSKLMMHLENMEEAETEEIKTFHDKEMHYVLADASKNVYIISTFNALNQIMEAYVPEMREKIFVGMETDEELAKAHRNLVEGVVEGNLEKALDGLFNHFKYIRLYLER